MHNSIDTCVFLFYVFNATGLCILTLKLPTSSQRFPHHFFLRSPPRGSRYQWWQESPHPRTWSPSKDGPLIRYIPKAQLRSRQFPFKFFAYHNPFFRSGKGDETGICNCHTDFDVWYTLRERGVFHSMENSPKRRPAVKDRTKTWRRCVIPCHWKHLDI